MTEPLRVAIVGLGMAGGFMAPILSTHPRVCLAGAAEPDARLRDRFHAGTGLQADPSLDALLARDEIDAVYIATPHQFHRDHAIASLRAGKHVVVEKPMALALEDCNQMIAVADACDRVLMVGHTHGYDPVVRTMASLVAARRYGRLAMLNLMNFTDFMYRPRRPEELDTQRGGGIFYNQLPHQIDMARLIAGEPVVAVRCGSGILDPKRPTEGHLSAFVQFAGGAFATITYSGFDRFDSDEFHFGIGDVGYPRKPDPGSSWRAFRDRQQGGQQETVLRRDLYGYGSRAFSGLAPPAHQPHFGMLLASCEQADMRPSADGLLVYDIDGVRELEVAGKGRFAGQDSVWNDLHAAVSAGKPPPQDGRFARTTLAVCRAMLRSARDQKEIRVPVD